MINIADIITEFSAWYLANRANLTNLKNKLFTPNDTEQHFTLQPIASTRYETAYGIMARVTQPWKQTWSPTTALTLKPKVIQLQKLKIDLEEMPDQFENTWLAFLARPNATDTAKNLDRATWPFIRWYLEMYVIPQHKEDLCLNEDFFGVQTAPVGGATPGAAGIIYDGIRKQIDDNVTAGITHQVVTGALEVVNTDFVKQLEDWVRSILAAYPYLNGRALKLFMNQNHATRYKNGFRDLYGVHQDFSGLNKQYIVDTKVEVVGLNSMLNDPADPGTASDRIFLTLPENCTTLVKLGDNKDYFKVEGLKRTLYLYTDYFRAIGFEQDQYVYSNELV